MNPTLKSVSTRIAQRIAGPGAAFDPTWIVTIAELLIPLIEALQECFANAGDAAQAVQRPGLREKRYVRILAKERFRGTGRGWRREAQRYAEAVIAEGNEITTTDLDELMG